MVKFRQLLLTILIAATLVASGAFAQTNLTQILDTITNPDGSLFNGTVVITWNGYSGSGSGTVSRLSTSARVYNGALSVLLVPTTTASPGTYYQVVYSSSNGLVTWTETWQVPPSNTALTVAAVRQTSTEGSGSGSGSGGGSGGGQYATLPISISEVTDLASDLSTINSTLTTVQTNATSLSNTVNGLSTTVTGQGATLTNLNNTVTGLNSTVTSQSGTLSSLNSTVGGLNTTITSQGNTLTTLSNSVGALNTTLSGQSTSIGALNTNVGSLTTSVSSNTNSITSVNTTVNGISTNLTNLTNLVNGLNATVNTLSAAGSTAVFVDAATPTGAINGTNLTFSLANTPAPSTSLTLFRNGLALAQGSDYTLNGSAITFTASTTPQIGDVLLVYYRMSGTGSATNFTDAEAPGGAINGTNLTFTLASAPTPAASLRLFRNGVLVAPSEYTLSGSSITFSAARAPQAGDSLSAFFRH